jgi:glycosyltransferase 2 family protein
LRSRQTATVTALTLIIYLQDALALWCVVKSVGLGLGFADALVLLGVASLSTIVPSGPAFIGTLQFAYALAIESAGAPPAIGVAAATIVQLCILLPTALVAVAILIHRSGGALSGVLAKREPKLTAVSS